MDAMKNTIVKNAILNALATALYIVLVASFVFYVPKIFAADGPDTVLAPVAMLSLLVFSAALTGWLVLGRPVLWYLDGRKREAVALFGYTLAAFFGITIVAFLVLFLAQ